MKFEFDIDVKEALSEKDKRHLGALYTMIWPEATYDPTTASVEKFARELLPHIQALNESLKFKE